MNTLLVACAAGTRLAIRVSPRAPRESIDGVRDGRLIVRVTAAPVDDAANDAVRRVVAKHFGVAKRDVQITAGLRSRNKTIEIAGLRPDLVARLMAKAT